MAPAMSPAGLALLLDGGDNAAQAMFFAGIAAAGPLAAVAYRSAGKGAGMAAAGRLAAAVAAPVAAVALVPSGFTAAADAAAAVLPKPQRAAPASAAETGPDSQAPPSLKPMLDLFHPRHVAWVYTKNMGTAVLVVVNHYMLELLEHEKACIVAEEANAPAPAAPALPDLAPSLERGLVTGSREFAIQNTRRLYEHIAARRLPPHRAEALLRDSRAYIKDVLSRKHHGSTLGRRFGAYFFVTLHSLALQYAADCTVSVAMHSYRAWGLRRLKGALRFWYRGVALQVARCSITLVVASLGAATGSLASPGAGTLAGQLPFEIGIPIVWGITTERLLALPQ